MLPAQERYMRFILVKVGTCQERNMVCTACKEPETCGCIRILGHAGMCLSACGISWVATGKKVEPLVTFQFRRNWESLPRRITAFRNFWKSRWLTAHGK